MSDKEYYTDSFLHIYILDNIHIVAFFILILRILYLRINENTIRNRKNEQRLNEVRNKIAYDMHQDIGNDLNALVFKIRNWHFKYNHQKTHEFEQLEKNALGIIAKVNDIVWSLDNKKNNLVSLQEHFIAYAEETFQSSHIKCEIVAAKRIPKKQIKQETKKNLFLIFKEALHNIVKHANAKEVRISFSYKFRTLKIIIEDDGKGIDFENINKGNGLDTMENRMKQLQGKIQISRRHPQGTMVTYELKI